MSNKILVCALEPSANLHLEQVLLKLKDYELLGIFDEKFGKPYMKSSEFSAMGFIEVLPLVFKAKKAMKELVKLAKDVDSILLIDSPAFNLPFAKSLKEAGVKAKITYYILPQVWAWKEKRVAKVERYCDNLASILPFDDRYYSKSQYVGHPLLDEIKFKKTDISSNSQIAFLPGSRKSEITRLMPIFKELATHINTKKVICVPKHLMDSLDEIYGDLSEFEISNDTPKTLFESEFAFICSGTATLEAALIGTPFVLCYKAKALDVWLARKFLKIKYAGLANIIFDFIGKRAIHDELIQDDVSVENLLKSYKECDRDIFLSSCNELRNFLKHGSSQNVANMINGGKNE
ncbi:lipid A disaccharide synthase [Campylobacter pinnipediorum subsp. caledonicus]|uniref:Lipid-A-disaccharide synthase n=1 Tax=Campylobacter pinnipediorum subsp. caledonicus TaxID=1874362 RepID=A0A1S6U9E6_9BACT|nr:lipid-A-disaccharide synthase [Campylobacter pinnipediorum]AQW88320.1 lipid A disaccharide synthase [Campylobacter pinnipediorum subsp. caledonicus]